MDTKNSIMNKIETILEKIDSGIDSLLNYDVVYSILIIICIIVIVFPNFLDVLNTLLPKCYKISNTLPKILFMIIILYFSKKDMRFAVLLSIIFLLMIEKQNSRDLNDNIIKLLVNDSKQDEELNKLNRQLTPSR
jgi:small-conductance mechanosensitive channel